MSEALKTFETLEPAFLATTYRVLLRGEWADVRIGQELPSELVSMLERANQQSWAIITAENPCSKLLDSDENSRRRQALERHLDASGLIHIKTKHIADDPAWALEHGVFVLGITETEALALGQAWGQLAVVVGKLAGGPEGAWKNNPTLKKVPASEKVLLSLNPASEIG